MIQINPLKSYIDGGVRAALTTPPSASLVFDLPGKAIWVKGVKLKGTDHTYTFSHDNYITLTNTPDSNESEDIKIGVNTSALKSAIDTTYGVVSTTANGLAPKFTSGNKLAASAATTYYFLGWAGTTLKWYQAPFRNIRINSETTDRLGVNNTDPLIIGSGNGISVTWDSTNKKIVITNTKPDVNHNTDRTGIKLATVSGTKKTDSTLILANSTSGLNIQGGTNKFLIGDGTNYIEVPVTPSFTVSNKDATIGTALTTIATIAGVDIKAKIASYSLSNHTHSVKINGSTKTIAASGAVDLGNYLPLSGGTMTGSIYIPGLSATIIHTTNSSSNYIYISELLTGSNKSATNYQASIGWHNTGGSGNGALILAPYAQNSDPWLGNVGLYIAQNSLKFNGTAISLVGHTHSWNSLTHSSTTENQAILTNGSANGWKLYTLNISGWNNAANNAHSHSNKSVLDGITSTLVSNWNTAYNFVNTISGTDTDKVINKWDEIVNFLTGISEDDKLNTLLNSKLSVYKLADNTNVGAIKNNGIYYSTFDDSSSTLVNSPFSNSFTLINITSHDNGDDLRRSRLAFNAYGEIKVSNDRGLANTTETWYNILTSKNTYVSENKGYINDTQITYVNNSGNATNATNARKLVNWYSTRPTSLNTQFGDGSLRIFYATSSTTEGKSPDDATILHLAWDNNGGWDTQLGINSPSGRVYSRAQNSGTWQSWKTLAFTTDIPTSLKNPYSLTTFGVVYDGSAAKTVTTSTFISLVTEGTSTITDGTMFITSYASNSGFADTNAVNVPYKRKAIHLWEYIKAKTDSLYATKSHNHDDKYVRAFGTSNDNIDSDWGLSFKTFNPIPLGTPPELNPNISILNIGNNFNRRKLLAFIYNNDNIYYRRHVDNGFTNWVKLLHTGNSNISGGGNTWGSSITVNINGTSKTLTIPGNPNTDYRVTQSETTTANYRPLVVGYTNVSTAGSGMTGSVTNQVYLSNKFYVQPSTGNLYATNFVGTLSGNASTATNADKVDGYHASSLWRSDGATWNPGANVSLNASGNDQEWSFDIRRNGHTGCCWHVWDSSLNTMLKVNADNGKVYAPYNFVGNLEGNATTATKLQTARKIWGQPFNGTANVDGTINVSGTSGNYNQGIRIHTFTNSALSSIWFKATNADGYQAGMWGISVDDNGMRFRGNTSKTATSDPIDYMNILHGGNVGIGITNPSSKLTINGDISLFNVGSIRNLAIGGGIYWNPYVESTTDGSDTASITVVKSGVAGGTTLVLRLMNDANDTILFLTSTAAKLYHNSYPILTTLNTYVSNNKGYINGVEITLVNNASSATTATKLASTGYANNALSYYQTDQAFDGSATGWSHYIIANHGDGSSYYHYTIRLPFWSVPQYRRLTGNTSNVTSWYNFITAENISSQSVNYASSSGNADTCDGLHVHSSRNNEANKIVRTDGNGFILAGWINTISGDMGTTAINKIYCSNDSYIRYKTPANFFETLSNDGNQISITIGSQNRKLTVNYASFTKTLDKVFLPSSTSNAANTAWCKFARITFNNSAWSAASGYLFFGGCENPDNRAILVYHFRSGNTATTLATANLYWLVKSYNNATVIAVKAADNVYDLYTNNSGTYLSPCIYHMSAFSNKFTWSIGNWTTTKPTAAYTSSDIGRVNYANSAGNADTVDGLHLYTRNLGINGSSWTFASTANANATTHIYAATSAGTSGQILKSTGGTPTWINQSDIIAGKVTCTVGTADVFRPIVLTNESNQLYYNTKIKGNYSTGKIQLSGIEIEDAAGNTPLIRFGSANKNSILWKVYSNDTTYANQGVYGFDMTYFGTGSGNANRLVLHADNQNSTTKVEAISITQDGVVTFSKTISGSINGNANTVDGQHFNWNNNKNDHTYLWAASNNGNAYLVHRASISVNYANSAGNADTLDGYHANAFATANHTHSWSSITSKPCTLISYRRNGENIDANNWRVRECSLIEIRNAELTYSNLAMSGFNSFFNFWTPDGIVCTQFQIGDGAFYYRSKQSASATITTNWHRVMDSNNCSLSKSGETLTIKINGTSQSLTNTWRGIQDNLTSSTNTTESLSAKQGYLLANGSARDNTKLPLSGGTMTGTINANDNTPNTGIKFKNNSANLNALNNLHLILGSAIRFGAYDTWDWNVWAGLKYNSSSKTIYLGLADGTIFNSNSALSGGSLRFPGISNVYAPTFSGNLSGNASTATKLLTTRTIWGQSFNGTANIDNTLRIKQTTGNYCEGIRIQTADGAWSTIILGATADSGTNTNAWSIHRKADNNFAISRNSSDGVNGLVMTSTGMGLGTTAPTQRLDVRGNTTITGSITASSAFINTGDSTLKICSGKITDAKSDGNICLQTSIDGTDGQLHAYPTQHGSRCNLVLQPRGGQVYVGINPDGGNTAYKLYVNGDIYSSTYIRAASGFVKGGSSNSYVLLGGGSHKALSDFSMAHSHPYLPLSGGTMTGVIKSTYTKGSWIGGVTNAILKGEYTGYGAILSMPVKDGRVSLSSYPANDNNIYFGYATTAQINAGTNSFNKLMFWDAANNNLHAGVFTGYLSGNASTASKWATARTLTIGNTGKSVDGSGNVSWTLAEIGAATSGHTHTLSLASDTGTSSITLAHGGKYKLTAGGNSVIFTLPTDNNTNPANYYWANVKVSATSNVGTTPQFGKVKINTTSSTYQLNVGGDSYVTGWSRAAKGFYCHDTGVHFTHNGTKGQIAITSNNEFCWGANSDTLYFNYAAPSLGTTVTKYVWNAGSSSTYASHTTGDIILGNGLYQLKRGGYATSWYRGRDTAIIRQTNLYGIVTNACYAIISSETYYGSWEISTYLENLYFSYVTDTAFNNADPAYIPSLVRIDSSAGVHATRFYEHSDIRYKKILRNLSINSNTIATLPLFDFEWIENNVIGTGTSALAVLLILPNLVSGTDRLTLDYGVLGTIAGITACKELVTLKSELLQLKEKVKELEDKLRKYENI